MVSNKLLCDIYQLINVVSHKFLRTKSPVHKFPRDIETAILIKLQSIGNIPFSNNKRPLSATLCKYTLQYLFF